MGLAVRERGCQCQNGPEAVFVVEQSSEGGLVARAVGASMFTEADSLERLRGAVRKAVPCHFGEAAAPTLSRLRIARRWRSEVIVLPSLAKGEVSVNSRRVDPITVQNMHQ